jgi:uncharacterized protein (TIGR00661 family)
MKASSKKILVSPLNWGLGHATRCVPIIKALLDNHFEVVLASDGVALKLLQKEFPKLTSYELSSYQIEYATKAHLFKLKILLNSHKVFNAMRKERKEVEQIIEKEQIDGLISDNRLGVYSRKVPNVFITHQLNVLSGATTALSSWWHRRIFKKYDFIWVPDFEHEPNLTGKLGHLKKKLDQMRYLGPLSRFTPSAQKESFDLMVLLSGPEPQRTLLEEKLLDELSGFKGKIVFVQGKIQSEQKSTSIINASNTIQKVNFMQSEELELHLKQSKLILCRSGYTTVMDLAKLGKKAFFIPTPGQYEQEYLAERLDALQIVPFCSQSDFNLKALDRVEDYEGLSVFSESIDWSSLFKEAF